MKKISWPIKDENFKEIIKSLPVAVGIFDLNMRYLAVSQRWIDDYKLNDHEIIGLSHYEVFPEIPERWRDIHRRGLNGEIIVNKEDTFTREDGVVQWLSWIVRPWYGPEQTIAGVIIFTEDITSRKVAELHLIEEREIFKILVDLSSDYYWDIDEQFRYRSISPSIEQKSKLNIQDFIGKTRWERSFIGISEEQWNNHRATLVAHQPFRNFEGGLVNEVGELRWFSMNGNPIFSSDGRFIGYRGVTSDITDIKNSLNALQKLESRYRLLFENMSAGFVLFEVLLDQQGAPFDLVIIAANKNFMNYIGMQVSDTIGKRLTEVIFGIEKDNVDWIALFGQVALTGNPIQFESSSSILDLSYTISAYQPSHNQCAVIFNDITELKKTQIELKRSNENLKKSLNQTLHALSKMVEIRDPYTAGHEKRVGIIASDIARSMGWSEDACYEMQLIGLVHDIGKISAPTEILSKPGRLSDLEY